MGFKVDLTGVELKSFDPVPEGRYLAKVSDLQYTEKSKASGKPKCQFVFDILEGIDDNTRGLLDVKGRKAFYEISLQDQSKWNLVRTLVALGDTEEDLDGEMDLEKEDYIGRECVLLMGIRMHDDIERQETRRVEPVKVAA